MKFIPALFIIWLYSQATLLNAQPCQQLPESFISYDQAFEKIKKADFKIEDSVDCSVSSWIKEASFYSCDGEIGYFILKTKNGNEYLHKGLPLKVWNEFKNASSFGGYYNRQIKGKYLLKIESGYY